MQRKSSSFRSVLFIIFSCIIVIRVETLGMSDSCCAIIQGDVCTTNVLIDNSYSNVSCLEGITQINGNLTLYNTNFTDLTGLEGLITIVGNLNITNNDDLLSFDGLSSLVSIGEFYLTHNPLITNFTGFSSLQNAYLFFIGSNNKFQSTVGLDSLTTVPSYIYFSGTPALYDLSGFSKLTHIYSLQIYDSSITTFKGLSSVIDIRFLTIVGNTKLTSLSELKSLTTVIDTIVLYNNPNLTDVAVLCPLLTDPPNVNVSNNIGCTLVNQYDEFKSCGCGLQYNEIEQSNPITIQYNVFQHVDLVSRVDNQTVLGSVEFDAFTLNDTGNIILNTDSPSLSILKGAALKDYLDGLIVSPLISLKLNNNNGIEFNKKVRITLAVDEDIVASGSLSSSSLSSFALVYLGGNNDTWVIEDDILSLENNGTTELIFKSTAVKLVGETTHFTVFGILLTRLIASSSSAGASSSSQSSNGVGGILGDGSDGSRVDGDGDGGLSSGALAGIIIGSVMFVVVVVIVIVIISAVVLFFRSKRQRKQIAGVANLQDL